MTDLKSEIGPLIEQLLRLSGGLKLSGLRGSVIEGTFKIGLGDDDSPSKYSFAAEGFGNAGYHGHPHGGGNAGACHAVVLAYDSRGVVAGVEGLGPDGDLPSIRQNCHGKADIEPFLALGLARTQ